MRPDLLFDEGVPQERTAMAWERTGFAFIVVGAAIGRSARGTSAIWLAVATAALALGVGAGMLVWSGSRYETLHGTLRAGDSPVQFRAAALVGAVAVTVSGIALVVGVAEVI